MISIVIPVFNEQASLEPLYRETATVMEPLNVDWEIVFVDDGSSDGSTAVISALAAADPRVHYVILRRNFGKSAALQVGFKKARGDVIITMDADLQDDPVEIPRFIKELEGGCDLVSGWKVDRQDPREKTVSSRIFNAVVSKLSGLRLKDYNCGFKCYRRQVIDEIRLYGELHRFIPFLAHKKGFHIREIPVHHRKRQFGTSKFGLERYARGFFDLLTVLFITTYLNRPMHLFGWIGALFFCSGAALFSYLFFGRWLLGQSIGTSPLFSISIFLIGTGIQTFIIGTVAELIVYNRERQQLDSYSIREEDR